MYSVINEDEAVEMSGEDDADAFEDGEGDGEFEELEESAELDEEQEEIAEDVAQERFFVAGSGAGLQGQGGQAGGEAGFDSAGAGVALPGIAQAAGQGWNESAA